MNTGSKPVPFSLLFSVAIESAGDERRRESNVEVDPKEMGVDVGLSTVCGVGSGGGIF